MVLAAGALLLAGAGFAIFILWISGALWAGSEEVRQSLCDDLGDWHATQSAFLKRVNEPRSLEEPRLQTTQDLFVDSARLALPPADGEQEEELRANLREAVRLEEQWLSELSLYEGLTSTGSSASSEQRVASYRRAEELRVSLNDALREANAQLEGSCGLAPLPLYE
ncbi:MAG: hypothetical protein WEE64_11955 [Dehalococcoidia bacterium]